VREDGFDEEEVRERVPDGLVDEVVAGLEGVEGGGLGGGFGFRFADGADGGAREDDGAVAVGLEVDANVESSGGVVEVLDARRGADDGQREDLVDVVCACAVGVGGLHDADLEGGGEASGLGEVAEEGGCEGGDAVAVEEDEARGGVGGVVD